MRGSQLRPSSSDERLLRLTTALFVKPRLNQPCTFFRIPPAFDRCGSHLEWTQQPNFFSSSIVKDWVKCWSHSSLQTSIQLLLWKEIFPILCWIIWSTRNKVAFEGLEFNHQQIFHRVKSLAIDLHFSLPQQRDKPNKTNFLLGWTPPPLGFFKLNTDGSAQGNPGFACAGGLIRDSAGRWIRGFLHLIGFTTSLAAKLWGLRDGLKLACSLHICKLIIEIDAKVVVDLISVENAVAQDAHPYSALIFDCRCLMHSFEEAHLRHVHRERNCSADLLSKTRNFSSDVFSEFVSPPPFVVIQLLADSWGVLYPRLL
jgi:ribonuclease HI